MKGPGDRQEMLDNPAYAGLALFDDEQVAAQWDLIVERATWDAVQRRRTSDPRGCQTSANLDGDDDGAHDDAATG